jgi:hypothetical protein
MQTKNPHCIKGPSSDQMVSRPTWILANIEAAKRRLVKGGVCFLLRGLFALRWQSKGVGMGGGYAMGILSLFVY